MNVIFDKTTHAIQFRDLNEGDVFLDDDLICMKMEAIKDRYGDISNGVNLRNGDVYTYDDENMIIPLEGNLKVSRV
jgi:hypothetical protein